MMRADQIKRLEELEEKLADAFLLEADPAEWPGAGVPPMEQSREQRGDAAWVKKNAISTAKLLRYAMDIKATHADPSGSEAKKPDNALEDQIRKAEKQAEEAVERVLKKAKGTAPHGR